MSGEPNFTVLFFRTEAGREPVREWREQRMRKAET